MLEVILLNPPAKHNKRVSQTELEALAGWPGRRAKRLGGNPARARSRKRASTRTSTLRRVSRPWSGRRAGKKLAAPAPRSATRSSPVAAHRKSSPRRASRRLTMAKGKTKRRKTRKGTIKRYLRKAKSKKLWPYAHKGGHRAAMGKAAGSAGLTRHDWARGLGRRGGKRAHGKRVKRFRVLARADRYGYRIAANKRRRGGKQRRVYDNIVTDNPRRKRRGSRRGYRRVRHNLGIITDNPFVDSIKEVFTMDTLVEAGQVTLGSLAAVVIPNLLYSIPAVGNVVPAALKSGWGSYLVNLLATGAASGVASYMGKSKLARNLLIGGVSGTMTKIVMEQLVPKLPAEVQARTGLKGYGLGILTADMEAAVEQAVSTELARQGVSGMEDYLVPGEAGTPQLGGLDDYLVPVEASIPQLAGFGDDDAQEVEFF